MVDKATYLLQIHCLIDINRFTCFPKTVLFKVGIKLIQIYPGSSWVNGCNERFNRMLRHELLNAEWFNTTKQAQIGINQWLKQYNHIGPHHSLNIRPPVTEILQKSGT